MTRQISRALIVDELNTAYREFKWCFELVSSLSRYQNSEDTGQSILSFQVRLFRAIEKLEEVYRRIKKEENRLILKKDRLNAVWFPKRMAKLAYYRKVIMEALTIGRAIGDGFAWFFYQRERELIGQHLKHQKQNLLPPYIGRLGERLTLENLQGLAGHLLLYHGITSFLRMGDISFIDLKSFRVVTIGELKTHSVEKDKVTVSTSFLAKDKNNFLKLVEEKITETPGESKDTKKLPAAMQDRLDRQMKVMRSAISNLGEEPVEKATAVSHEFYFDTLSDVVSRCHSKSFEFAKAGDGFLIGALKLPKTKTWGDHLLRKTIGNMDRLFSPLSEWAKQILHEKSKYNAVFIGSVGEGERLSFSEGQMPFLMWPLSESILEDIIFQDVIVVTLYNPAFLIEQLRQRGFKIEMGERGKIKSVKRTHEKSVIELTNMNYYIGLIQDSLMTETAVIALIDQMTDMAIQREKDKGGSMAIELRPQILISNFPEET